MANGKIVQIIGAVVDAEFPRESLPKVYDLGKMTVELETARLWLRRQIDLETCEPPIASKTEVVQHWRMAKGTASEACFEVAQLAMKMCGTSGTANKGVIARMLRDIAMSLVMAFPAERGRLEAAKSITDGAETKSFTVSEK